MRWIEHPFKTVSGEYTIVHNHNMNHFTLLYKDIELGLYSSRGWAMMAAEVHRIEITPKKHHTPIWVSLALTLAFISLLVLC